MDLQRVCEALPSARMPPANGPALRTFDGKYGGITSAFSKIGAFISLTLFPLITAAAGADTVKGGQYQSWCFLGNILRILGSLQGKTYCWRLS
jgi:hypothetical protein